MSLSSSRLAEAPAAHDDIMDIDEPINVETVGPLFPALSASGSVNPFSLLDEHIGRTSFGRRGDVDVRSRAPRVSHPREVREIPIEFKDDNSHSGLSSHGPNIEFLAENDSVVGSETFGLVTVGEEDEDLPVALNPSVAGQTEERYDHPRMTVLEPSAPQVGMVADNNDIEEEMIKAAIEASKRDAQRYSSLEFDAPSVCLCPVCIFFSLRFLCCSFFLSIWLFSYYFRCHIVASYQKGIILWRTLSLLVQFHYL